MVEFDQIYTTMMITFTTQFAIQFVGEILRIINIQFILNFLKEKIKIKKDYKSQIIFTAKKINTFYSSEIVVPIEYSSILKYMVSNGINVRNLTKISNNNYFKSNTINTKLLIDESCYVDNMLYEKMEYELIIENRKKILIKFENSMETFGEKEKQYLYKMHIYSHDYTTEQLYNRISILVHLYTKENKKYVEHEEKYYYSLCDIEKTSSDGKKSYEKIWLSNTMTSQKTFDNTFFTDKDILLKKINFFKNNENFYNKKGIPYNIGFMFYGDPGCGKTSCIKALAKHTNRHVVEINLSKISTCGEFENIFSSDTFHGNYIPDSKKIIVFEDIDCMMDVVHQRKNNDEIETDNTKNKDTILDNVSSGSSNTKESSILEQILLANNNKDNKPSDKLTLSCILNAIDGVCESKGRILIITTNFPEKLDSALVRPGRIDQKIHFTKCDNKMTRDIIENFYEIELDEKTKFKDYEHTPAEIIELCFKHFDDSEKIVQILEK